MTQNKWRAYGDLAWTEPLLAFPDEYAEGARHFMSLIRKHSRIKVRTLLHLGCGAGGHDHTFKESLEVTGVDISEGMLAQARRLNPEIRYIRGDMRTVRLGETFDAVAIPDSIGYMTARTDLRRALATADRHLRPGGVLLVAALVREDFRENNFVYTGSRGDVDLVVFENNHARGPRSATYEATVIHLIRRKGRMTIFSEVHKQGLFPLAVWRSLLRERGFRIAQRRMDHAYDPFIVGDGRYRMRTFCALAAASA